MCDEKSVLKGHIKPLTTHWLHSKWLCSNTNYAKLFSTYKIFTSKVVSWEMSQT